MALSVMGPSVVPITGITPSFVIYDPADANANHTKFIVALVVLFMSQYL